MAISVTFFDETTGRNNSVQADFLGDFLADAGGGNPNELQYFFQFQTGAQDADNLSYQSRYVKKLDDLALNGTKRSSANSATEYEDITTMITDYMYDYLYGHTANQFSSGCAYKAPMKF